MVANGLETTREQTTSSTRLSNTDVKRQGNWLEALALESEGLVLRACSPSLATHPQQVSVGTPENHCCTSQGCTEFHNEGVVSAFCQNLVLSLHSEIVLAKVTRNLFIAKANGGLSVFILLELLTTLQLRPSITSLCVKPNSFAFCNALGSLCLFLMGDSWSSLDNSSSLAPQMAVSQGPSPSLGLFPESLLQQLHAG